MTIRRPFDPIKHSQLLETYSEEIKSFDRKISFISNNRWNLGGRTHWYPPEDSYAKGHEKEYQMVVSGKKPMALVLGQKNKDKKFIEKCKRFCDKTKGYSYGYLQTNRAPFVYGKTFNVFLAENLHLLKNHNFDIILGLLLGYPVKKIAAFENRNWMRFQGETFDFAVRPIRSRNPIEDILSGKRDLVKIQAPSKYNWKQEHEFISEKLNELHKIVRENLNLYFFEIYEPKAGGLKAKPTIIFGKIECFPPELR